MLRSWLAPLAVLLFSSCVFAQETHIVRPPAPEAPVRRAALSPEQKKLGTDLLKIAEADAAGLEGGMRAWTTWQVARCYKPTDKTKALDLLETALIATRSVDDDKLDTRATLQQSILAEMVPLAPKRVDELLPSVDPSVRKKALPLLLAHYREQKDMDRAVEFVYRIASEDEIPYDVVSKLMDGMKAEQQGEFVQLFSASLNSYSQHKHTEFDPDSFPELLVRYSRRLPKELVIQSIDEVLKQADPANSEDKKSKVFTISSSKGAASFNTMFEYRLFQLLPVLRTVDESAAESYLKKYRDVATQFKKYPKGANSFVPDEPELQRDQNNPAGAVNYQVSDDSSTAPGMVEIGLLQKYVEEAEAGKTADALAHAETLNDAQLRTACFHNIARVTLKKYPSAARTAIERMLANAPQAPENFAPKPFFELMAYRVAADVYLIMGDEAASRKAIEKGLSLCGKVLQANANPDDPNKALKAYWPSVDSYRALIRQAAKISPAWALELLNEIPDPEAKAVVETTLAATWLDVPLGFSVGTMMMNTKNNDGVLTGGMEAVD